MMQVVYERMRLLPIKFPHVGIDRKIFVLNCGHPEETLKKPFTDQKLLVSRR